MLQRVSPGVTTTDGPAAVEATVCTAGGRSVASAGSRSVQPGLMKSASRSREPSGWVRPVFRSRISVYRSGSPRWRSARSQRVSPRWTVIDGRATDGAAAADVGVVAGAAGAARGAASAGATGVRVATRALAAAGLAGVLMALVVATRRPAVAIRRAAVRWRPPSIGIRGACTRRADAASSTRTEPVNAAQVAQATAPSTARRRDPSSGDMTRSHSCPQVGTWSGR